MSVLQTGGQAAADRQGAADERARLEAWRRIWAPPVAARAGTPASRMPDAARPGAALPIERSAWTAFPLPFPAVPDVSDEADRATNRVAAMKAYAETQA